MFIITKKSLSRRAVLRGMGATLALPFLDAMVPAVVKAAEPIRRFGAIFSGLGERPGYWASKQAGGDLELLAILKPLEPYRKWITVVSEMRNDISGHAATTAGWLSGARAKRTIAEDFQNGPTIDQIIARQISHDTPLPSLELATENFEGYIGGCDPSYSCAYENTISWASPTTPIPMELDPRVAFERLFGSSGTSAQRVARMVEDRSILDSITEDLSDLNQRLGLQDRTRLDEYMQDVREIEQRIQKNEKKAQTNPAALPDAPIGIPESFEEHASLMYSIAALALQADITRVFTFMMTRDISMRVYPELGITEPHHAMSHHGNDTQKMLNLVKLNTYHISLFAKFIEKLKSSPDGDGSLLDHSVILYGSGMGESNVHSPIDIPTVFVGTGNGVLKGNRHILAPKETPIANLWIDLAGKFGVRVEKMGLSTGRLEVL
jgi:hypothetical protein